MATTQLKNHVSRLCELSPGCRSHGSVQYTREASTNSTSGRLRRRATAWRRSVARSPRFDPTERNTFAMPDLVASASRPLKKGPHLLRTGTLLSGLRVCQHLASDAG